MILLTYCKKVKYRLGTVRYWSVLGGNYGYGRQASHLWQRWRDPEHDRITCVCCCTDCDVEEDQ